MESWLKRSISEAGVSDSLGPLNKNAKIHLQSNIASTKICMHCWDSHAPTLSHPRQCVFSVAIHCQTNP